MPILKEAMEQNEQESPPADVQENPEQMQGAQSNPQEATPEEQESFDRVVTAGMKVIYDGSTHDKIMTMLKSGEPADALAQTVSTIMMQLDEKSGGKLPKIVVLPAANELLGEVSQLATVAKIFEVDEMTIMVALQKIVTRVLQHYGADKDELSAVMQSVPHEQIQGIVSKFSQYGDSQKPQPAASAPQPQPGA